MKAALNDLASVAAPITDNTVAVMLEPVQREGGVIPASRLMHGRLCTRTKQHTLLLIVDEMQSGMGRTGSLFAYPLADVASDSLSARKPPVSLPSLTISARTPFNKLSMFLTRPPSTVFRFAQTWSACLDRALSPESRAASLWNTPPGLTYSALESWF